jgi:hypothetical protein
MAKAKGHLSVW